MSRAALGFFRATRAHTRQNPYPYTRVRVLIGTGHGLGITHGYQNPYAIKMRVHIFGSEYNPVITFRYVSLSVCDIFTYHISEPNINHTTPCDNVSGASISNNTIQMIPTQCHI